MKDYSDGAVDRCVEFVLRFISADRHRSRLPAAEQRREHARALEYLNRLAPDTLTRALHRLYRAGEAEQRRAARTQRRTTGHR